jgi:PAS domain-containing protein
MKERLGEKEEEYRLAVENATVGIYIFQDGKFVFVNKAMDPYSTVPGKKYLGKPHIERECRVV